MQKKIKCKLNGKQSITIPIHLKKNGRYLSEDVNILVRGFLKFYTPSSSSPSSETSENLDASQKEAIYKLGQKSIVYPVLFTSNTVRAINGKTTITLLPRSEDIITDYQTILGRINYDNTSTISNSNILSEANVSMEEKLDQSYTGIVIQTGVQRNPYYISIEITILDYSGKYYGQTIDRGLSEISQSNILSQEKSSSTSNLIISCYNDEDWIPTVTPILSTNLSDSTEILYELETLNDSVPFGASPVYDAIISSSKILSTSLNDRKIIYLFTDNESNMSIATLNESINYINNLNGYKKTPVIIGNLATSKPLTLSATASSSDTRDLNKIAALTGGQSQTIFSEDGTTELVKIFYGKTVGSLGYGTYSFIIDLQETVLIENVEADFGTIESGSNASWSIEYSLNSYSFNTLSKKYLPNQIVDLSTKNIFARYLKINTILIMGFGENQISFSPSLDSIIINYNKAKTTYLYLNKKNNDIPIYQMSMAVNSNNISPEQIEVGLAKSDAINWDDFISSSQPPIKQNGKIVIPIRFSPDVSSIPQEPLLKIDNYTLRAKNGQWDNEASIILYDKNYEVIDSLNYKTYPRSGIIILNSKLPLGYYDGDYKIGIINKPEYKIGLKITNSTKLNPVEIYAIGEMHTTGKDLLPTASKLPPEAKNVKALPELVTMFSPVSVSYSFYDANFDKENISKVRIKWYINDIYIPYLDNLKKWNDIQDDNDVLWSKVFTFLKKDLLPRQTIIDKAREKNESILHAGDRVYCTVQVSDGELYSQITKSSIIQVQESAPVAYNLQVKAMKSDNSITDRLSSNTAAVARFDFFSDATVKENRSTIIWFVNGYEFKRGVYGTPPDPANPNKRKVDEIHPGDISPNDISLLGLNTGNRIFYQLIPASASLNGTIQTSNTIEVMNELPIASDAIILPSSPTKYQSLLLKWTFFDFEIDILKGTTQIDMSIIKWYRKQEGQTVFTEVTDIESLAEITTSLSDKTSRVNSSILRTGQEWYATITPNDSISDGLTIQSPPVTILAS